MVVNADPSPKGDRRDSPNENEVILFFFFLFLYALLASTSDIYLTFQHLS